MLSKKLGTWAKTRTSELTLFGERSLKLNHQDTMIDNRKHVWLRINAAIQEKNLTPILKYGGGKVVWRYFAAAEPVQVVESMKSTVYQRELE